MLRDPYLILMVQNGCSLSGILASRPGLRSRGQKDFKRIIIEAFLLMKRKSQAASFVVLRSPGFLTAWSRSLYSILCFSDSSLYADEPPHFLDSFAVVAAKVASILWNPEETIASEARGLGPRTCLNGPSPEALATHRSCSLIQGVWNSLTILRILFPVIQAMSGTWPSIIRFRIDWSVVSCVMDISPSCIYMLWI